MNPHRLRIFCAVAQRGTITAAAGDLLLSQPAVSIQLKALEKELGLPLFERGGPKLRLTHAGEVLHRAAVSILSAKDEAERAIGELRDGTKGRLILGAGTTGGMYVLPRILQAYKREWPDTEIVFQVGTTDQMLEKLLQNTLDMAMAGGPVEDRRLAAEVICTDELVLIAAPSHPIASLGKVTLKDLSGAAFIVPEGGSRTRQLTERRLREAGVAFRAAVQLPGTEGVKKGVEAGLGVGFVSRFAIEPECLAEVLRIIPIEGWRLTRPMCLFYRAGKYFSPASERFREFAKSYGAQHLEGPPGGPAKRERTPRSRSGSRSSGHPVGPRGVSRAAGRGKRLNRRARG